MQAGEPTSVDEALEWLQKHFEAEAARGLNVAYQYVLSGPGGGSLHACIDNGRLQVAAGDLDSPDVCFQLAASDFFGVLAGRENADLLFTAGRIEVEGDLSLALKMRKLFRPQR